MYFHINHARLAHNFRSVLIVIIHGINNRKIKILKVNHAMPKQKLIVLLVLVQIIELLNLQQENVFVMMNITMMEVTMFVNLAVMLGLFIFLFNLLLIALHVM